jgi:uncharacterized cupredoxin-like copper-binding protein
MRRALALMSMAAMLFAACAKDEAEPEAATPTAIEVTSANYKFVAPATVKAGAVQIDLTNAGPEPHQAQLLKLKAGVTAKNVIEAAKGDESEADLFAKLATPAGGPNGIDAGAKQTAVLDLVAGRYAFVCLIPDPKGRAHAALGMVKELSVTANEDEASVPEAAYSASAKDFAFTAPTAWNGAIEFTNAGKQPHEYQVLGVAEGKTPEDVEKSFKGGSESGPPPWTAKGGGAVIAPGDSETFEMDLKAGTYFLMCFVADPVKKAPHFALGMMKRFEVKE